MHFLPRVLFNRNKFLYEELNAKGYTLFKFSYSNLTSSEKVRFIYSLRGRDKRGGILKKLNALELAAGVVLVPVNATFEFKEFLLRWKIEYECVPILIGEFNASLEDCDKHVTHLSTTTK
ncbi:hypothetical protein DRN44_01610 [Thermococci archaeon]|nr:MAG: hypothetical protein DRN44_01610 [Thermococci archaeon]